MRQTVPQIASKLHLKQLDLSVAEGDQGQYRQSLVIDKRGYGVVELEKGHAKLIPENYLNHVQPGQPIEFVRERSDGQGSPLKAIQLCQLTQAQIHLIESKRDKLVSHFGLQVSTLVRAGDRGMLLDKVRLNDERFAVIKMGNKEAKLVPMVWLDRDCCRGDSVHVSRQLSDSGKEMLHVRSDSEMAPSRGGRERVDDFEIGER